MRGTPSQPTEEKREHLWESVRAMKSADDPAGKDSRSADGRKRNAESKRGRSPEPRWDDETAKNQDSLVQEKPRNCADGDGAGGSQLMSSDLVPRPDHECDEYLPPVPASGAPLSEPLQEIAGD